MTRSSDLPNLSARSAIASISAAEASGYAAALIDEGYDAPKDLVGLELDERQSKAVVEQRKGR